MLQKWLTKISWNYFYFLNSIVAVIIIPSKTVNDTHSLKNRIWESWESIFDAFLYIWKEVLFDSFYSLFFLMSMGNNELLPTNCKALSSFCTFLLGEFFFKFVACWKVSGCWCKVTITISLFKRQVYIKTFDFPKLSKVSFIASIKSNIKAWLFCISNAV